MAKPLIPSCDQWRVKTLSDLHMTGCLPIHTWKGAPTPVNTMACQGQREVRGTRSLLWLNALLLEMTQFSPNSMIYWMCDLRSSFSFLSLLFLFYEMGIIVSIPPEILPSSWHFFRRLSYILGFPGSSVVKNPPANAEAVGNASSIPGSRGSPGVGNGYQLQYSCQIIPWAEEPGGLQSIGLQSQTRLST